MNGSTRHSHSVDQLAAMIGSGRLPPRAREMGERVLDRLADPVRIAVLGHPESGLGNVVNALLDASVLPNRAGLPPMELAFAQRPGIGVVTADGEQCWVSQAEFDRLDPWSLAMVRFAAPLDMLLQLSFLVVPLEGDEREIDAAVGWAARRADMAICCLAEAGDRHSRYLRHLPAGLVDHAFLAVTAQLRMPSGPLGQEQSGGFRAVHFLGRGPEQDRRLERFRSQLLDHVDAARREDIEGALVFLDRYQAMRPKDPVEEVVDSDVPDFSELLDTPHADGEATPDPASRRSAEIVTFLAAQAGELAHLCDRPEEAAGKQAALEVLGHCAESIHACNEMAMGEDGPVADVLAEASDLILLMQIEETPDAMTDAVALMVQLRHECEALLCA